MIYYILKESKPMIISPYFKALLPFISSYDFYDVKLYHNGKIIRRTELASKNLYDFIARLRITFPKLQAINFKFIDHVLFDNPEKHPKNIINGEEIAKDIEYNLLEEAQFLDENDEIIFIMKIDKSVDGSNMLTNLTAFFLELREEIKD